MARMSTKNWHYVHFYYQNGTTDSHARYSELFEEDKPPIFLAYLILTIVTSDLIKYRTYSSYFHYIQRNVSAAPDLTPHFCQFL